MKHWGEIAVIIFMAFLSIGIIGVGIGLLPLVEVWFIHFVAEMSFISFEMIFAVGFALGVFLLPIYIFTLAD